MNWTEGTALGDIYPDSDTSSVGKYNLFIAAVKCNVAGLNSQTFPVLCTRDEDRICGSLSIVSPAEDSIRTFILLFNYTEEGSVLTLEKSRSMVHAAGGSNGTISDTTKQYVTALYALL